MTRWPYIVMAVAAILFVATACAPPPPAAWYDAGSDVVHYDDVEMAQVATDWGQPGVDWIAAHEAGHRTMMQVWRTQNVALWLLMPGATANIQIEQLAQCLASASGAVQPWRWGPAAVAAGYWTCSDDYVALVKQQVSS